MLRSSQLLEREQQLLALNRESRQALIASSKGGGGGAGGGSAVKISSATKLSAIRSHTAGDENFNSNNRGGGRRLHQPPRSRGGKDSTPVKAATIGGDDGGEASIDAIKEEITELLRLHEPAKHDKLHDLFAKFVGKEDILLQKMRRRYSKLSNTPAKERQRAAFDKSISRMGMNNIKT